VLDVIFIDFYYLFFNGNEAVKTDGFIDFYYLFFNAAKLSKVTLSLFRYLFFSIDKTYWLYRILCVSASENAAQR